MVPEIWKTCDDVGWTAAEKGNKRVSEAGKRILLFGSTGTIGRATAGELKARGHEAVCVVRHGANTQDETTGTTFRTANFADPKSIIEAMRGERFDVVLSCMASRTGAPADAWAVDHDAHTSILNAAKRAGILHFIFHLLEINHRLPAGPLQRIC